ncbi:NADP-dependent oxidoreductase [Micromonospora sp. URMC 106]|uniref:NADP-dependent oxidoreductase n=1 Tax=Micromonospora sp. URMC 106 TaxID=3423408 RepID=UPI003F1A8E09
MRAVVIQQFGPPELLQVRDLPTPTPGEGEVLVRVHAAGVNAIDWFTRAGQGVAVSRFPAVLGWDVSGVVTASGAGVNGLPVGSEVFGMGGFPRLIGGYAQYAVVAADALARKPEGTDHATAAATPMPALTAWQTIVTHAAVTAGQRVLVHGAAGGVGHLAVQLAAAAGAHVIGTASARNHDLVSALGASEVIDYTRQPVEAVVRDADVVVDPIGGDVAVGLLATLRPGGLLVTLKGRSPRLESAAAQRGVRLAHTYVTPDGAAMAQVAQLLGDGRLRVEVQQVFPLDQAATAHAIGERGHVRGRLVLDTLDAA